MRLLIDTNVILDFLMDRQGFGDEAANVIRLAEEDATLEFVSASAVTDIFYTIQKAFRQSEKYRLLSKESKSMLAQQKIRDLKLLVSILPVTEENMDFALDLGWEDFEDAVQYAVAMTNNIDYIITRNADDYEEKIIPALSPREFLNIYQVENDRCNGV